MRKYISVKPENIIIILGIVVVFLAQLTEIKDFNIGIYMAYIIIILWSIFTSPKNILLMTFFLLSDNRILDIAGISIQLILMLIYLVKFRLIKSSKIYSDILLISVIEIIYCFIYHTYGINEVLQGFKFAVVILFYTLLLTESDLLNKETYKSLIKISVIGVVSSIIIAILLNPVSLLNGRFAISEDSNWNLLGILSAFLFAHAILMYFYEETNKNKIFLVYSILMIICAMVTTSRTALIVVLFSFVWIIMFIGKSKKTTNKKFVTIVCIFILMFLIFTGIIKISFLDKLIDRITNPRQGDISNGRFTLWTQYISYLISHEKVLFFGNGNPLVEGIIVASDTESLVAHNLFIEQIVTYGIVGNIIIASMYVVSYKTIKHKYLEDYSGNIRMHKRYLLNIILIFIAGMFSHLLTSVLVTSELYLGIIQYIVLASNEKGEK